MKDNTPPIPPAFLKRPEVPQGAHYKIAPGEQHHQRAMRLKLNWYAGNITKYAERAPHKGQEVEDLIKIIDYAAMWLETHGALPKDQALRLNTVLNRLTQSYAPVDAAKLVQDPVAWAGAAKTVISGDATPAYVNQDRKP